MGAFVSTPPPGHHYIPSVQKFALSVRPSVTISFPLSILSNMTSEDINKYKECIETACGSLYSNDNNCYSRDDIDELYENI